MITFAGPAEVRGFYQKVREILQFVLVIIFVILPWLKWNNQPILLLDIFNRHFIIFGFNFYSHEAPLLFFFLILVLLSIFIITAVFGRLWCGWACPQTVFLHFVFNKIEKLIMGTYAKRQLSYRSTDSFTEQIKILAVYITFFLVSWVLAHSFVAYFMGAQQVTQYISDGPAQHIKAFTVLMLMTFVLYLNFTFFREKLCFFVCPYGRFQNALIDNNTLTVFYDQTRGEPRSKMREASLDSGDCIDCQRCVNVCPTKIDIRKGFQLECIACAKCIDACNEVMDKIKKPKYLIRYETGDQNKISFKRFRLLLYAILFASFLVAFVWSLTNRNAIDLMLTRSHEQPFITRIESENKILQNQFQLHLKNQKNIKTKVKIYLAEKNVNEGFVFLSPAVNLELDPEQDIKVPAFIEINESFAAQLIQKQSAEVEVILETENDKISRKIQFVRSN